jgi:Protein of unknown function (DUF2510)
VLYEPVRRPFWQRHPWVTLTCGVLAFSLVINGAYTVVALAAGAAVIVAIRRHLNAERRRRAGLCARADYEHRLSLAGDPRGIYGRYPPVQAGWFPDPQNRYLMRYFDGAVWTPRTHTQTFGQ